MSLTSAMLVGFTGIRANQTMVDTVGDNVANVNTTAFKNQRTLFETLLYETMSEGTSPGDETGGSNPRQVGRGVGVSAVQRNFTQGAIERTGIAQDVALNGRGFFIVDDASAGQVYTRDGAFRLDATQTLVSPNGAPVLGYAVDEAGNVVRETLTNLVIPIGTESEAIATTNVIMDGELNSADVVAAAGQVQASQPLFSTSGDPATAATPLTDLVDANGEPLLTNGDPVTFQISKGAGAIEAIQFTVGETGSTLGDLASFLETELGLLADATIEPDAGVRVAGPEDPVPGALILGSLRGGVNALTVTAGGPFVFTTRQEAVGEGAATSFMINDSLGNDVPVSLSMFIEEKTNDSTTWRFYAESAGDSDLSPLLGTGTLRFDANGQLIGVEGNSLSIDRAGEGVATPLTVTVDFTGVNSLARPTDGSQILMESHDGAPAGTLIDYGIDQNGVIIGAYSNSREQVLGQLAVATFANDEGLVARADNTFVPGPNSGDPLVAVANEGVAGSVVAGALEQSNVELVREFINLITASTGISASSRVVRASDDLLQQLLALAQ